MKKTYIVLLFIMLSFTVYANGSTQVTNIGIGNLKLTQTTHHAGWAYAELPQLKKILHFITSAQTGISFNYRDALDYFKRAQSIDHDISKIKFWAVTIVAMLLLAVIALLMSNVKRKAATNLQLRDLNDEVSRQKNNLDRINQHLEEIIDQRTKDLQIKNKKLSEYSSYLSHQIRGPIATLKGLINLEKEELIDKQECIDMMDKCVSEIDEKIVEISEMLHNKEGIV